MNLYNQGPHGQYATEAFLALLLETSLHLTKVGTKDRHFNLDDTNKYISVLTRYAGFSTPTDEMLRDLQTYVADYLE